MLIGGTNIRPSIKRYNDGRKEMGREGIEPSLPVYKTDGLPLSYRALESYLIQELA